MAAADKAFQAENTAFQTIKKNTNGVATAFQEPAGADAGFPDFGFTFNMPNGKKIDVHIEFKSKHTDQMGSMRDWKFDGREFSSPDAKSEQKAELIALMNGTPTALANAKAILKDLQAHFHHTVKEISSGCLSVVKDKFARRKYLDNYVAKKSKDYVIANISSPALGNKFLTHYENKFAKSRRAGVDGSILAILMGKEIWWIDTHGSVTNDDKEVISKFLGASRPIKTISSVTARLECRIQPRGLSAPANNPKPVSIDVMASYRLQGKPANGTPIL